MCVSSDRNLRLKSNLGDQTGSDPPTRPNQALNGSGYFSGDLAVKLLERFSAIRADIQWQRSVECMTFSARRRLADIGGFIT